MSTSKKSKPVKKPPAAAKPKAKPAAKAKSPAARPAAKATAKAAKKPAAKAAKPAARPAPKAAPAPAKKAAGKFPAKVPAKAVARSAMPPRPAAPSAVPAAPASALAVPKPVARPAQTVSTKDLAAAHEYLLSRSAGRSHAEPAVTVDGRRLPTEEEMLAMPESDYMNEEQLAFFRHRLQQMERELLSNAGETTEHLRETVIVPDPADRATIEEEHALELRTRDRERKLLKKVQSSLASLDTGEYGYCEETGDPIGIPRLLARPTATLSLEAQQRREIKQKLFGD